VVKVVADEAVGGEWVTDGGGFWAVSSRLRRSGSISAKQGRARQGGRSAEVKEVGADLGRRAGSWPAIGDYGDGGGTSAACTKISVRLRGCHFLNSCAAWHGSLHRRHNHTAHTRKATCTSEIGSQFKGVDYDSGKKRSDEMGAQTHFRL
jgi:hypothetical protein